jgi:hypothetical protein
MGEGCLLRRYRLLLLGSMAFALLAMPAHAGASSWSIPKTPNPTEAKGSRVTGTACPAVFECLAVGYYEQKATGTPFLFAERWNGKEWSLQSPPSPVGAVSSFFMGISCSAKGACTAVGAYLTASFERLTLIERWNGSTWSIQKSPNPAGATVNALAAVSCPEASVCRAVGYTNGGSLKTLAEAWNGTEWSIQKTPEGEGQEFTGVSCTASNACTAVGSGAGAALAERWNGTEWSTQKVANPAGALGSSLSSVSCSKATACTAGGKYASAESASIALAESWNGTEWTVQKLSLPSGTKTSALGGISCPTATECMGAGEYSEKSGNTLTLVERLHGTEWTTLATPNPAGSNELQVSSISCFVTTECAFGGNYVNSEGTRGTLVEKYTAWKLSIIGPERIWLKDIACAATSSCIAVGIWSESSEGATTLGPLALKWNGSGWTTEKEIPLPAAVGEEEESIREGELASVSCSSSTACTSAGSYRVIGFGGTKRKALADTWNGSAWSSQKAASPGAQLNILNDVSCSSATACTAVGSYVNALSAVVPLVERWNGTTWSVETIPVPEGVPGNEFQGVSCPSTTFCVAVGSGSTGATLTESWNGKSWSIQKSPSPAKTALLKRVSCGSSTMCVAVGLVNPPSGSQQMLAEVWNGSEWKEQTPVIPPGAAARSLHDVSCPSSGWCEAVGNYVEGSNHLTVAEGWNGLEWGLQQTYNQGNGFNSFYGVGCASVASCIAVGIFGNGEEPGAGESNAYIE